MQLFFIKHELLSLAFLCLVKLRRDQPETLVVGEIVVHPIAKNKKTILHSQYQRQVQTHPYHPCNKSSEMKFFPESFRDRNVRYGEIASYCCQGSFIVIVKILKAVIILLLSQ